MNQNYSIQQHYQNADKMMLIISYGLALYALGLASWYNTWAEAVVIGLGSAAALTGIYLLAKGTALCRAAMGAGFMIFTALHIHQAHGMIEMHFGVFALLALLLFYRSWLPILIAAGVIAVHHFLFFYLQANGAGLWVLDSADRGVWVIFLHAAYVVVESALLIGFALKLHREARESLEITAVTSNIIQQQHFDLTQRTSGLSPMMQLFDSYTADIEALAKQVRENADNLKSEGDLLAGITGEMQQTSNSQQRETDMIATAVEEMSAAIREVSNHAEMAARASDQVETNARDATQVSIATRDAVQQLAKRIAQAATTIEALNEQAKSIGSVLDVIRGVAEQTNLLALNAAIEAARAGEQGRGFAVVADEVRTLAQRTQQSTAEIDQMIEALQAESRSAVNVILESQTATESCVENTTNSLSLMEGVSNAIQDINHMNTMIATSSTQQSHAIDEISQNLSNIVDTSKLAAEESLRAAERANILNQISDQLSQLTRRFHVSG